MRSLLIIALSTTTLAATARASTPAPEAGIAVRRGFGDPGHLVVSVGNMQLLRQQADGDGVIPASTTFSGSPAFDVVLPRDWTAGIGTVIFRRQITSDAAATAPDSTYTTYALSGRFGHVIPLAPFASFWPLVSFGVERGPRFFGTGSETALLATVDLPVVCHPSPRFFVGAGPTLSAGLGGQLDVVNLYGHIVFGGVFGG